MTLLQRGKISKLIHSIKKAGIPGWRRSLAPAFAPGRDPGDPGSNPTSGSRCMEPASPSACVSAPLSLSLSLSVTIINNKKKIHEGKIGRTAQNSVHRYNGRFQYHSLKNW